MNSSHGKDAGRPGYRLAAALMMPVLMLPALPLPAATKTASVGFSATLVAACSAGTTSNGVVSFGTLNFGTTSFLSRAISVTGQQNAGAIRIQCNNGTTWRVLLNGGNSGSPASRYLVGGPTSQRITYNLYTNAAYTTVWDNVTGVSGTGNGQILYLPVYGRIPAQATPSVGNYSDTVQVTVSW